MRIQVVHCHPLTESYNHALFGMIVETLQKGGHDVVATDLYREGFQPAMTVEERRSYMGPHYDGDAVAPYTDLLKTIEGIVFCFPHWWFVRLFAGDPGRKVMMRGMRPMCAKGVRSFYLAHYDMDHSIWRTMTWIIRRRRRARPSWRRSAGQSAEFDTPWLPIVLNRPQEKAEFPPQSKP